jgi:hypothetical protein
MERLLGFGHISEILEENTEWTIGNMQDDVALPDMEDSDEHS